MRRDRAERLRGGVLDKGDDRRYERALIEDA
jgi:hypothetical protein